MRVYLRTIDNIFIIAVSWYMYTTDFNCTSCQARTLAGGGGGGTARTRIGVST